MTGSERYGIAVFPTARFVVFDPTTPEPGPPWRPRGNRVSRNVVAGSGRADLALALGVRPGNCFTANRAARTAPRDLQTPNCSVSSAGDAAVAADLTRPVRAMLEETIQRRQPPPYTSMPKPPAQPSMP